MHYYIINSGDGTFQKRASWQKGEAPTADKPAFVGRGFVGQAPGYCKYLWLMASPVAPEDAPRDWVHITDPKAWLECGHHSTELLDEFQRMYC